MLIVLFLLVAGLTAGGICVYTFTQWGDDNPFSYIMIILGVMGLIAVVSAGVTGVYEISQEDVIDSKIEMYIEENTNIEQSVTESVEQYLEHEFAIFDSLQGEDIQTLLVVYPQINSNELVKKQIEIFTNNNAKIKELKEQKLNIDIWRFWLYFG